MLAILTIGAASATDEMLSDDENLTASPEDTIVESSVDEIELNANDEANIVGEGAELITDYDYSINVYDEYLIGKNVFVYSTLPKDATGTVQMTVDDEYEDESEVDPYGFYLSIPTSDVGIGLHNCKISYSGDDKYAGFEYQKEFQIGNVAANMPDELDEITSEENIITVNEDVTGQITINIDNEEYKTGLIEELKESYEEDRYCIYINWHKLSFGQHTYEIITTTDGEGTVTRTGSFNVTYRLEATNLDNIPYGKDFDIELSAPEDAKSNISVIFNGNSFEYPLTGSETIIPLTNLIVTADKSFTGKVTVKVNGIDVLVDIVEGAGANSTTGIVLPVKVGYDANLSFDGNDMFTEGQAKTTFNVSEKSASGNGSEDNKTNNTVPVKIVANDLSVYYNDGKKYTVTVYGTDGKVASKTQVIFKINSKKVGSAITDAKGIASLKITQIPKTYKITAEALGANITKTLKVNQVLKLQKVKVKRSAQKLVIKVTLKQGKKALKNKKITLKFKGKKYIKKTDKKGVAKFTIKKSVLKKLNRGKKITYTATYIKNTVKRTVKIK